MLGFIRNEKGILFPAAILLLLIVSFSLFSISAAYQSKYRTYHSLEMSYTNSVIKVMEGYKKSVP